MFEENRERSMFRLWPRCNSATYMRWARCSCLRKTIINDWSGTLRYYCSLKKNRLCSGKRQGRESIRSCFSFGEKTTLITHDEGLKHKHSKHSALATINSTVPVLLIVLRVQSTCAWWYPSRRRSRCHRAFDTMSTARDLKCQVSRDGAQ